MKKTISMVYRLAYIFFFLFALFTKLNFDIANVDIVLYSFALITDSLSAISMLFYVIMSIKGKPDGLIAKLKLISAFLSLVLLIMNYESIMGIVNVEWILNCLLPIMLLIDYILFDAKAKLIKQSSTLFKALFVALGAFAFYKIFGLDIAAFIEGLTSFSNLVSFLAILYMLLSFIYLIFSWSYKANFKNAEFEAILTVALITNFVLFSFSGNKTPDFPQVIIYYILPLMLVLNFIFFTPKSDIAGWKPIIWVLIVFAIFVVEYVLSTNLSYFKDITNLLIYNIGIPLSASYGIYIINLIKR